MENTPKRKTNWKIIVIAIILVVVQAVAVFYGYLLIAFSGWGPSQDVWNKGILLLFIATILPLLFLHYARKNKAIFVLVVNFLISFLAGLFLISSLSSFVIYEIQDYKKKKAFEAKTILETQASRIEYQKILTEIKSIKILGLDGTPVLKTDKYFVIVLTDISFTPAILDYLNKNVIGKQFNIIVPAFVSNQYPVSFAYQKWLCQCDLLVDGKSLVGILTEIYKNTQRK